jgi:GT2 family glycosyltransferase
MTVNPLDHPIVLAEPLRRTPGTPAWQEHIPFAFFLVLAQRPGLLVELGTHYGDSYCAFCQAVAAEGLETHCFAVDTWAGDPQAGEYGPEVLADLRAHHDPLYGTFSTLVQSTFDEAVERFEDGSIDLLHVDGLHTYEAVKSDFEMWLPKLSARGVVLVHDTATREEDFGVWRLWEELSARYPAFEFHHGHGLGVLGVGPEQPPELGRLFALEGADADTVRDLFRALGARLALASELDRLPDERSQLQAQVNERNREIEQLRRLASGREAELALVLNSLTWRAATPVRVAGRSALSAASWPLRTAERARELWAEQASDWSLLTRWERSEGERSGELVSARTAVTIAGVRKPALLTPPSTRVFFRLTIPEEASFRSTIGLLESEWGRSPPVRFTLEVRAADGSKRQAWTKTIDPTKRRWQRRWIPFEADLEAFEGREVELALCAEADGGWNDVAAAWGMPAVLRRKSVGGVLDVVRTYFGRHGIRGGVSRGVARLRGAHSEHASYQLWMARNDPSGADIERQRRESKTLAHRPLFSVLTPVHDPDHGVLRKATESVLAQSYDRWELVLVNDGSSDAGIAPILDGYARAEDRIRVVHRAESGGIVAASNDALAHAEGDFIVLLDHDDELSPDALFFVAEKLNEHPDADMVYSDEDKMDFQDRRFDPFFKPDWSPDYFRSCMYTCHLGVYRRPLVVELGGFRPRFDGAQDWDLVLRISERSKRIHHVPRVLYHWRSSPSSMASGPHAKPYAYKAAARALNEHLKRLERPGRCEPGPGEGFFRMHYEITERPLVSIAIPTGGRAREHGGTTFDPLLQCVKSIVARTAYDHFEILCVDDGELPPETARGLEALADERLRRLSFERPFNFAEKMNFAATHARGEHLLFLNDDTEVVSSEWLTALLEFSQQDDVGAVGAKLYFPGGGIQHGGVVVPRGLPGHVFYGFPSDHAGYYSNLLVICNYSAVTAACMMTRKDIFQDLGGFNPEFPLNYNDVDYCLRLRERGYRIVFTPYAELRHFESLSRNGQGTDEELERLARVWGERIERDPFYNPNFRQETGDYRLEV